MQVKIVVDAVAREMGDSSFITWTRSDLIDYLNQAVKQIILVRPDAGSVTENLDTAAGTQQTLPAGRSRLLKIVRNMGADGNSPGPTIRFEDSDTLDGFDPDWHSATPAGVFKNYVYDESEPRTYYLDPPADGSTKIEAVTVKVPTALDKDMDTATFEDSATVTGIDDIYQNTAMEWMKYKAFSSERASDTSRQSAHTHMQSFYHSLGVKLTSDLMNSPTQDTNGRA